MTRATEQLEPVKTGGFAAVQRGSVLRAIGSVLAVAVCGFFSLGTSCDSSTERVDTTVTVPFAAGQDAAAIDVRASGYELRLDFDQDVVVTRNGQPIDSMPRDRESWDPWLNPGDTVCSTFETESSAGTLRTTTRCVSQDLEGLARYEVFRSDVSSALEMNVTATIEGERSCSGEAPAALGVAVTVEPSP